jgi:hypothetical protein
MVGVVQLVERQVVILNVAGSSPVTHPNRSEVVLAPLTFFFERGFVPLACQWLGRGVALTARASRRSCTRSLAQRATFLE